MSSISDFVEMGLVEGGPASKMSKTSFSDAEDARNSALNTSTHSSKASCEDIFKLEW